MTRLLAVITVAALVGQTLAASCGGSGIPFRLEVLPQGQPVLGCASPSCFGAESGGKAILHDSQFSAGPNGEDGFFREGDLTRSRSRYADAPSQQAQCPSSFSSTSCPASNSWVGGIQEQSDGSLGVQCCKYEGMRFATEVGRPIVHAGEVYSGGEVIRDGRQTGFDLISNVRKVTGQDGSVAYELTVHRMNCLPDPVEEENDVGIESQSDINRILDKVVDVQEQGDGGNDQVVQVGEAVVPVQSAGYYYPVSGGVPACFSKDTIVQTTEGIKSMDEVEIGDMVLSMEGEMPRYSRVESFIHRLPDVETSFIKLETHQDDVLKLTPQHFIYRTECENPLFNVQMIHAEKLQVGDCLYKRSNSSDLDKVVVTDISVVTEIGAFSPMTANGDIIVNDLVASCHNVIRSSSLSHTLIHYMSKVESAVRHFFQLTDKSNGHIDLPFGFEYLFRALDQFVPAVMMK
uniref:HintN domain-containing protein n=1 Tax=Steinernema glaseri TaxID=37863 RepID=A0A1I8AUT3_9BILA